MRLSLVGSTGWSGSTYASRLPFPLVSRTNGAQPCALTSSFVSRYTFVLNQPSTVPLPENQRTSLLSRFRWCVPKQVSRVVICFVFGSYSSIWRPLWLIGNALADGWVDPSLQNACVWFCLTRAAIHTRPWLSMEKLWAFAWLCHMASSPQ